MAGYETVIALLAIVLCVLAFIAVIPKVWGKWSVVTKPANKDVEWASHLKADEDEGPASVVANDGEQRERSVHGDGPVGCARSL